jgi:hypothetical protein
MEVTATSLADEPVGTSGGVPPQGGFAGAPGRAGKECRWNSTWS